VIVYIPSLWNGFAYDDLEIIVANENLRSWSSVFDLVASPYWPGPDGAELGLWRPTTSLFLAGLWQVSGGSPPLFHVANVLLHAAVVYLLVRLVGTLFLPAIGGLTGIVFAVHPVHVEAVANGVGIAELITGVLVLGALGIVVRRERLSTVGTLSVVGLGALALGAKEHAVVLPGLILVVDAVQRRLRPGEFLGWIRNRAGVLVGLSAATLLMFWGRIEVLGGIASTRPPLGATMLEDIPRIWTLGEIWWQTLRLVTLPVWLSPDYAPGVIPVLTRWSLRGIAGVSGVLLGLAAALLAARAVRRPVSAAPVASALVLGVSWFVVAVFPSSNVPFLSGVLLAERTLYLPSIGSALVIGALVYFALVNSARLRLGSLLPIGATTLFFVLLTARTVTYIPAWQSQDSIFEHMIASVPESGRVAWVLGDLHLGGGDVDEALTYYRRALRNLGPAYFFLSESGRRLINAGEPTLAEAFLRRAHQERPDRFVALQLLTVSHSARGDWVGVERWGERAVAVNPDDATAWHLLSLSLAEQERWIEAAEARAETVRLDPELWQPRVMLAELRARAGQDSLAIASADSARVRTSDPSVIERLDSLVTAVHAGTPPPQ